MGVLSYQSIRKRMIVRSWQRICVTERFPGMIQPASLDVQLGGEMWIWSDSERAWTTMGLTAQGCWLLDPDRFYLGALRQFIRIPRDLLGKLEGKSSRGRDGILVHRAGVFDPGWGGCATLEIDVRRKREPLWPGMPIAQVVFEVLDEPTQMPYGSAGAGSHYQGDLGISASRLTDMPLMPAVSGLSTWQWPNGMSP